jgi:hypothetical protein
MRFLLMLLAAWQSAGTPAPCQARLDTHDQDGMLTVTGYCRNLTATPERYRYELTLHRESNGNLSQNTQRGEFAAAPQREVSLSQTRVNAGPQDTYRIYLRVFDTEGHTLAQDSLIQTPTR